MANIKSNNHRKIDCRILDDLYMDFMLSKNEAINTDIDTSKLLAAFLDFSQVKDKNVVSPIAWHNAQESNALLKNIGYTGVDNGFIRFEKDRISNDEFLDLFTNSTFDLSKHGDKFFVTEVTGNTKTKKYPIEYHNDYVALKGGFYQGFFKIEGTEYQTLPITLEDEWNFNIVLRRNNYVCPYNTLNQFNPDNAGFFLYIGTRAENKSWELYNQANTSESEQNNEGYDDGYFFIEENVIDTQYTTDNDDDDPCNDVFADDYVASQISLDNVVLKDSKGYELSETGFYEIETDNKFITFHRGENGYTVDTWDDNTQVILTGKTCTPNINYFPLLNRTTTGYTTDDIERIKEEYQNDYNIHNDIQNNALGFKINNNGSITYRYYVLDCDSENASKIIEETSMPGIVPMNEWVDINIKLNRMVSEKMKIYVYVDQKLKLVSKELPLIKLHGLNDLPERQEGVPYNISIGGGTLGLAERIMLDYYNTTKHLLPLEKYFAGTFIGDIKHFAFYDNRLPYSSICKINADF